MFKHSFFAVAVVLCFGLAACQGEKSDRDVKSYQLSADTITIVPDSSYLYLSAYSGTDVVEGADKLTALAFNWKTPSIDRFDIASKESLPPIFIEREGPNGILDDVFWIKTISADSILLCDGMRIYMIDNVGRVRKSYSMNVDGYTFATRNPRMHTAEPYYNPSTAEVYYPVNDNQELKIMSRNLLNDSLTTVCNIPGFTGKKYGFKVYPNVTFTDTTVIWNYPYEPKIYSRRLDANSDVKSSSHEMSLMTAECKTLGESPSMEDLTWHSYENPQYTEVRYLPNRNLYAQIVIGPTTIEGRSDEISAAINRPLYLRLFDGNMNPVLESALDNEPTMTAAGWFYTSDGVYRYIDSDDPDTIKIIRYSF